MSFSTVLQLIFITLKLTGNITWSWWWVLSPLWISVSLVLVVCGILILYYAFSESSEARTKRIILESLRK
jgi:hypothetical protein